MYHIYNFLQALVHASVSRGKKLFVDWVPSGDLEPTTAKEVIIDTQFLCGFPF